MNLTREGLGFQIFLVEGRPYAAEDREGEACREGVCQGLGFSMDPGS